MPALSINDAGTWRPIESVYVNDLGTWRRINAIYVNDLGTWRQVFSGEVVAISDITSFVDVATPSNATSFYSLNTDGTVTYADSNGTGTLLENWVTPTSLAGAAYEARATKVSGNNLTSGTLGTWLPISSNLQWTLTRSSIGSLQTVLTIEIRRASDLIVLDSATVTLHSLVEA
jgi:hypothetical protein